MRIGIDATCWANERGYGRYTRELVGAMVTEGAAHQFICLHDQRSAAVFTLDAPNVTSVIVPQSESPTLAASSGSRRKVIDMLRFTRAAYQARLDVFFSPSVYGFFPVPPGLPTIVTVHDAIAERFPRLILPTWKDRISWWAKVRLALMQSRLVMTVSDHAARQVTKHLRVPAARLRVTSEGVSDVYRPSSADQTREAALRARIPVNARWLTYVGGFGPHKYVDVLVRAHAAVAKRQTNSHLILVLVGHHSDGFHSDIERIRAVIKECGTEHLVRWVGYLPDQEVRHLHSGAVALVLASAAEGFGLPAVEAARCGTPVIATLESPLPQVLDGGGIFVVPGEVPPLENAIDRLCNDESGRQAMGARALERARALDWRRPARVVLEALEEVALVAEKVESNAHARP